MINQNILDYERKLLATEAEDGKFEIEEVSVGVGEGKINCNLGVTRNSITFPINGQEKLLEKPVPTLPEEARIFSNHLLRDSTKS